MSTLLVDIGNTRVKWALLRGEHPGPMKALAHERSPAAMKKLVEAAPRGLTRVLAVSVAPEKLNRALARAVKARFGVRVEFVGSTRGALGVRNGYRNTWRLGADRWVSAVGAHGLVPGRTVVLANVGTALTLDIVTADGRHRGGAIIPGPATMVASLLEGTHGIRRRAAGGAASTRTLFATDTASAVAAGSVFAAAAFVDRAFAEARKAFGQRPLLLLTGGGARALRKYLRTPAREVPDLVLRGLARFASA